MRKAMCKKFAMCIFLSRLAYIPLYCCDLLNVRTLAHIPVHPVSNMIFNCLPPQNQKKSATAIVFSSVPLCGLLFMLTVLLYCMGHMHTRQTTPSNLFFIVCGIAPTIGSLNNVVITGSRSSLPPVSASTSIAVSGYKLLGFLSRSVAHFSNPSNNLKQLLSKAKPSICGEATASCRSVIMETFFIFVPLSFLVRSALISPTTSKVPIVSSSNPFSAPSREVWLSGRRVSSPSRSPVAQGTYCPCVPLIRLGSCERCLSFPFFHPSRYDP